MDHAFPLGDGARVEWDDGAGGVTARADHHDLLTLLVPQSRLGDKPVKFQVFRPRNGTAEPRRVDVYSVVSCMICMICVISVI